MRRIESINDHMRGVVTFELENGERLCVDERAVRELGLQRLLRRYGYGEDAQMPDKRISVWQAGREIGTLPEWFDPLFAESDSWLYEPRAGDFKRTDVGWEADRMLGPGDLDAVRDFRWADEAYEAGRATRKAEGDAMTLAAFTASVDTLPKGQDTK